MLQQPHPRLDEFQKATIEVVLRQAVAKNEAFGSTDELADYLRRGGFADSLLHAESKHVIYNIYLKVIRNHIQSLRQQPPQSSQQATQPSSSSPTSSSSYSEPAPNPTKGILEEIEARDDIEPLSFLPQVSCFI
jgi:hypothetical protein